MLEIVRERLSAAERSGSGSAEAIQNCREAIGHLWFAIAPLLAGKVGVGRRPGPSTEDDQQAALKFLADALIMPRDLRPILAKFGEPSSRLGGPRKAKKLVWMRRAIEALNEVIRLNDLAGKGPDVTMRDIETDHRLMIPARTLYGWRKELENEASELRYTGTGFWLRYGKPRYKMMQMRRALAVLRWAYLGAMQFEPRNKYKK